VSHSEFLTSGSPIAATSVIDPGGRSSGPSTQALVTSVRSVPIAVFDTAYFHPCMDEMLDTVTER
jgi:hypothetical protein